MLTRTPAAAQGRLLKILRNKQRRDAQSLREKERKARAAVTKNDPDSSGLSLTLRIGALMAVIALGAKVIMMYDESTEPERIARQARQFAEDQETLKPLTREEWDTIQQIQPLTPFDGPVDRSQARIRTGHWPGFRQIGSWAADSLNTALEREEAVYSRPGTKAP